MLELSRISLASLWFGNPQNVEFGGGPFPSVEGLLINPLSANIEAGSPGERKSSCFGGESWLLFVAFESALLKPSYGLEASGHGKKIPAACSYCALPHPAQVLISIFSLEEEHRWSKSWSTGTASGWC